MYGIDWNTLRILFCTDAKGPDYQCDSLLHGLVSLDAVDVDVCALAPARYIARRFLRKRHPLWYMLDSAHKSDLSSLYGKGFTLYGKLPSCGTLISPFAAVNNIIIGMYDLVIVDRIWQNEWLFRVCQSIRYQKVIVIDGEDHQKLHQIHLNCYRYFKRELSSTPTGSLRPISFAVPQQLVLPRLTEKLGIVAPLIPGKHETYIYQTESEYYSAYQKHWFGITMKKAGWDCMRHYEIAMNGCIPLMRDIEECPPFTMTSLPK